MKTIAANASRATRHTLSALAGFIVLVACAAVTSATAAPLDLMLVVDNSGSMKKNDPDFLTRDAVTTLVEGLGRDDRAGLVLFGESATLEVPLTGQDDLAAAFAGVRDKIDFSGQFTNSPAALERAIYELTFHGRPGAQKSVVFMTDGIVDTGDAEVDREKTAWMRNGLTRDARKAGVTIHAIAFSESADFFLIQSLAQQTDGDYYRVLNAADLATTFDRIRQSLENLPPPDDLFADDIQTTDEIAGDPTQDFPLDEPFGADDQETTTAPEAAVAVPAPAAILEFEPPTEPAGGSGNPWLWGGLALLLFGLTVLLLVLRRRRGVATAVTAATVTGPPAALLRDLDQITDQPEIDISTGTTVVGRVAGSDTGDVNYLIIDDATISRRHAVIQERNLNYWISDAGSTNGTFVNGQRVVGEVQLRHADQVRFHHFNFEFVLPDLADGDATQVAPRPVADEALNATVKVDAAALAAAQAQAAAGENQAAQRPASSPGTNPAGPLESTLDAAGDVDHIDLDFGEQDGAATSANADGLTETVIVDPARKPDATPDAGNDPGSQGELDGLGETAVFNADDLRPGAANEPASGDDPGNDANQDDLDATVIRQPDD